MPAVLLRWCRTCAVFHDTEITAPSGRRAHGGAAPSVMSYFESSVFEHKLGENGVCPGKP